VAPNKKKKSIKKKAKKKKKKRKNKKKKRGGMKRKQNELEWGWVAFKSTKKVGPGGTTNLFPWGQCGERDAGGEGKKGNQKAQGLWGGGGHELPRM